MADVAIYARYSSHSQRDASIDDQVRVCTDYARREGDSVVRIYAEPARSGTDAIHRPVFLQMVSESRSGDWTKLYIYKLDRFARNREDAALYKAQLKRNGVVVVSVTEPISDGPVGVLMEGILESYNEFYSKQLSQNIRRGLEGNALKCGHNGVKVYGYDLGRDGLYHVNEDEAEVVRMAFRLVDSGETVAEVSRRLASHRTKRGGRFTAGQVGKMLRNEKYKGVYSFKGHRVPGGMEAIVSEELFDRVNSKISVRHKRTAYSYALSGKLYDREGRRFVGTSARGKGGAYCYYRVQETGESYRRDDVDAAVARAVSDFLGSEPGLRETIAREVVRLQDEALGDERAVAESMRHRIAELERKADNLVEVIAQTGNPRLAAKLNDLDEERSALARELAEVERSAPRLTEGMLLAAMDAIVSMDAPMEVVEKFVGRVVISGRKMTVTFNVAERTANPAASDDGGCSRVFPLVDLREPRTNFIAVGIAPGGFLLAFVWR